MSPAIEGKAPPHELSEIVERFRDPNLRRRAGSLSPAEQARYQALFSQLSDALAQGEIHRSPDARRFLRVRSEMELTVRYGEEKELVACHDFGGGGCRITSARELPLGIDLWLDGALLEGVRHPLEGRAVVVWTRSFVEAAESVRGYGLRFAIDSDPMRDQIDRVFYRVLDLFLKQPAR